MLAFSAFGFPAFWKAGKQRKQLKVWCADHRFADEGLYSTRKIPVNMNLIVSITVDDRLSF